MLIKGITKLSELNIDADKNWNVKGITNIKEVATALSRGDLVVKGDTVIVKFSAGPVSYVLTSQGPGKLPTWAPAGGALRYYFPASIYGSVSAAIFAASQLINKNGPLTTHLAGATGDDPGDLIRLLTPSISLTDTEIVIAAPDKTISKTVQPRSGLSILVDGFVEETALGVQTDHTAEARESTANDLNLCPMSDTVLDKIYIGSNHKFWQAQIQVGTNGAGNWTNVCYYWNGAWTACVGEIDGSNDFQQGTGLKFITHTPQGDWALSVIMGMNLYWMMIRTDNFVNRVTKPLGSQVWVAIA